MIYVFVAIATTAFGKHHVSRANALGLVQKKSVYHPEFVKKDIAKMFGIDKFDQNIH